MLGVKTIKRIVMGAGYLEGFGTHPGNTAMVCAILGGALAGHRGGVWGILGGAVFTAVCLLPFWMKGCYDRAVLYERNVERTFNILNNKSI